MNAASPARPPAPAIDLKRSLSLRVTLFALLVCALASALVLQQAQSRIRGHVERSGGTIERLLAGEAAQPRDEFRRSLEGLELSMLEEFGRLLHLCVEVDDIYGRRVAARCFAEDADPPSAMRWLLGRLIGPEVRYEGTIRQFPGAKVGVFAVTPDLDSEALEVWRQLRTVLAIGAGVLLLNLLVYLPVRRALRPADRILATLARMERGDLSARMPRPALIELRRISAGFDHLAERLQETSRGQQQLAQRLLAVREEERRHLARELHDEFGQCLASIRAEAACVAELAAERVPALQPSADAIARTAAQMMEALQGILHQLRPVGLEMFGLRAGLEQLVAGWRRARPACRYALQVDDDIDGLPDDLTVSLYRIVQESLTNAARHGEPGEIVVALRRDAGAIELRIDDDGHGGEAGTAGSGLGVLGMHERVQALGGSFALLPRSPCGVRVQARFPLYTEGRHEPEPSETAPAAGR